MYYTPVHYLLAEDSEPEYKRPSWRNENVFSNNTGLALWALYELTVMFPLRNEDVHYDWLESYINFD